jgi:hypothetical protein
MRDRRDNRIRTRKLPPPQYVYNPSPRRGSARRRYYARRRRHRAGTFRALLGWFLLGALGALIVAGIIMPLAIRSLPPRVVVRLPPFMQCFHPDFCRENIDQTLPTAAASANVASILIAPTSTATAQPAYIPPPTQDPNIATLPVITSTPDNGWTVHTPTAPPPSPTLIPSTTQPIDNPVADQPPPTPSALDFSTPTPTDVIPLTPTATTTLTPTAVSALPEASHLLGFRHISQTWNNCGPATLTMGLNYWGWQGTQATAAHTLKPDPEDKNVTPEQMVDFINDDIPDLKAVSRHAGDILLIKRLILAGYPVVIETGFVPDGYDWMGHYRLIVGYSDPEASFYVFDSYLGEGGGQGRVERYDYIDEVWQHFNRAYLVIYRPEQEAHLAGILGDNWDPVLNAQHALRVAQIEAQTDRGNPFAWFNLGTSFALAGQYEQATIAYDEARNIGLPWRMLWYQFGPFEAYLNTNRLDDVLALARANLNNTPYVEETYYYRGMAYMKEGQYSEAEYQFRQAIQHNPNFTPAHQALEEARRLS